jgi:hypothetical protein
MNRKPTIKLDLLPAELSRLRANKIRLGDIASYPVDELAILLNVDNMRAMELHALVEFQLIPSIGIKFAQDLISMGYYSLDELREKDGARLVEEFELMNGYWIDPCVEDQFRLVVDYAQNSDNHKVWWDYTQERKEYRSQNGYPANRPKKAWFDKE